MKRLSLAPLLAIAIACGGSPIPRPTEADRARGAARFPDLTLTELTQGRTLYVSRCGSCHTLKRPTELTARQWEVEVGEMREKNGVKLSDAEARAIVRYLTISSGS